MFKFIVLSITILSALATQQTPIPTIPDGYSLGSTTPTLHLEAFFDLACSDCQATWGLLEPILRNEYNVTTSKTLRFTVHLFPLAFHTNAFLLAQGARVIAENLSDIEDIFSYFNLIFKNQPDYYPTNTLNFTQNQIHQNLTNLVQSALPEYAAAFTTGLVYGSQADGEARISWKYGCSRAVTGTPTFLANGVEVDDAGDFTADDWRNFLNGNYNAISI